MRRLRRRGRAVIGGLALAAAVALVPTASASAVTFPNACKNSASINRSQIDVEMTADAPALAAPGDSFTLSNIEQTLGVPGAIFVAGYNLGLLTVGENTVPATAKTIIEGTNTDEGTQLTDVPSSSITTTISDPDGTPSTGDESGSDGALSVTYADQTWTAAGGAAGTTIKFRQETVDPISAAAGGTGGVVISAKVAGIITVTFGCSPGTVSGPDPGEVTFDDPATPFASTTVEGTPVVVNKIKIGKPRLNKKRGTATLPVEVPSDGKLKLKQTSKLKGKTKFCPGRGTFDLVVKLKKGLKKGGKAKVTASVVFAATAGPGKPATKAKKLKKLTLKRNR